MLAVEPGDDGFPFVQVIEDQFPVAVAPAFDRLDDEVAVTLARDRRAGLGWLRGELLLLRFHGEKVCSAADAQRTELL
jgi:hypothetical protein